MWWTILTAKPTLIALAAIAGFGLGYHRASDRAAELARISQLELDLASVSAALEIKETDIQIAKRAEEAAKLQATRLQQEAEKSDDTIRQYEQELLARPDRDACAINDADRRRLLDINPGTAPSRNP